MLGISFKEKKESRDKTGKPNARNDEQDNYKL